MSVIPFKESDGVSKNVFKQWPLRNKKWPP